MRVLTFSTSFPKGHPKAGSHTFFVERILSCIHDGQIVLDNICDDLKPFINDFELIATGMPKGHTIRAGSRWKAGDMASLRIWSGVPRRSKQIEFAQVEVKKVWPVEIYIGNLIVEIRIDEMSQSLEQKEVIAKNDALELIDFVNWFKIPPKAKKGIAFTGQIITWSPSINYPP